METKNNHSIFLLFFIITIASIQFSCTRLSGSDTNHGPESVEKINVMVEKKDTPLNFKDIQGKWRLKYRNNYGYYFKFYKNFKSRVILYLHNHALVFKGVYTIENNQIRINIYEMKRARRFSNVNSRKGFVKAKSSYFLFKGQIQELKKKKYLVVSPVKIEIDGNNSDGYFEPEIKLKRLR